MVISVFASWWLLTSQHIRFARVCSFYECFILGILLLKKSFILKLMCCCLVSEHFKRISLYLDRMRTPKLLNALVTSTTFGASTNNFTQNKKDCLQDLYATEVTWCTFIYFYKTHSRKTTIPIYMHRPVLTVDHKQVIVPVRCCPKQVLSFDKAVISRAQCTILLRSKLILVRLILYPPPETLWQPYKTAR